MSNAATAEKPEPIVRKRGPKRASEFDSREVKITQKPSITMPELDEKLERTPDIVIPETNLEPKELDLLAFNEEPVKILIHRSGEKFQPKTTDLIAVNGIKAEMLFRNGWIQIGYLPRGQAIYTKRKYVEQLAHAKVDHVSTEVIDPDGERPVNRTDRVTSAVCTFSVLEDKNPRGVDWLEGLLRSQS